MPSRNLESTVLYFLYDDIIFLLSYRKGMYSGEEMSDRAGKQIFHRKARKFNKWSSGGPLADESSHFEHLASDSRRVKRKVLEGRKFIISTGPRLCRKFWLPFLFSTGVYPWKFVDTLRPYHESIALVTLGVCMGQCVNGDAWEIAGRGDREGKDIACREACGPARNYRSSPLAEVASENIARRVFRS